MKKTSPFNHYKNLSSENLKNLEQSDIKYASI